MATPDTRFPTILALASELKGLPFIEECKRQGCRVVLFTNEALRHEPWPWDSVAEHHTLWDIRQQPDLTRLALRVARAHRIARIVALDDYDVETAADLREHFRLAGMGHSAARLFRDKLAMRARAQECGLPQPAFTDLFDSESVRRFVEQVSPPWVLKPRALAGSEGIRVLHDPAQVLHALEELGERYSHFLLEQFMEGAVFHVDALVWEKEIVFSLCSRYGAPPLAALQGRGVFSTCTIAAESEEARALQDLHQRVLLDALGRRDGPSHTEFIRDAAGRFHFLESAARVAGGYIEKHIEAATDLVMWREAARIELALLRGEPYAVPPVRHGHAGLIAAPSRVPFADTSAYADPEIYYRPRSREFVSLIVGAASIARVEALLIDYAARFRADFMS